MDRVQSWKVEKVKRAGRIPASKLVFATGLPRGGLDDAELWCVKGEGGRIVGVAGLETRGRQGLLRSVAVDKDHRRAGVGTSLVRHVISSPRPRPCSSRSWGLAQSIGLKSAATSWTLSNSRKHAQRPRP